jgi:hypothetical protein
VKSSFFFVMLCSVLIIPYYNCYAQESTSLDLLNNAKQYDGKTINYKGEVIGDVMIRGDHAWLHVNDGTIAIGIWVPKTMIQNICYVGDYDRKGDIIEVSGTFNRSCLEHGGDLDIHASGIRIISLGSSIIRPISRKKCYIGAYSLITVLLFLALNKFFQNRQS